MARMALVRADDPAVDPEAAAVLVAVEGAQDVAVLNVRCALANHPDAMEAFFNFAGIVYFENNLNPARARLSDLCGHQRLLLANTAARGARSERRHVRGEDCLSPRRPSPRGSVPPDEAAIMVLARKSTRMEPIDDGTWAALKEHFDTRQITEIIFTIGLDQIVSRFHAAVRTDVDDYTLERVADACRVHLPPPPPEATVP